MDWKLGNKSNGQNSHTAPIGHHNNLLWYRGLQVHDYCTDIASVVEDKKKSAN